MWLHTTTTRCPGGGTCSSPDTLARWNTRKYHWNTPRTASPGSNWHTYTSATSRFSAAITARMAGGRIPAAAMAAITAAPATMKPALTTLLAAIIRARCDGSDRSWIVA